MVIIHTIKNLGMVNKALEYSVFTVSLPPHSKKDMQPLDVGFMKSLKRIMHKKLCKLFGPAFRRAAIKEDLVNSFIKT
jgi:hypothetical protein